MIDKSPLISIIIPVYKVEGYLQACVDSVLYQSFTDYELILVDDGSPDGCPALCDEYAGMDERVKVIHKENGGLSDARNAGILHSSGKYLLFIDSDDYIAAGSLEKISEAVNLSDEPDIIFLNSRCIHYDGRTDSFGSSYDKNIIYGKSKMEILHYLAQIPQFHMSACFKLVKRRLIIDDEIFFTKGLLQEDVDWGIKLYLHAERFGCCDHVHYYRRYRKGSIMSSGFSEKRFSDLLFIISKWVGLSGGEYKEYKNIIHLFLYHRYHTLVLMYGDKDNKNRRRFKPVMKEYAWLLDIDRRWETVLVRIFYNLFGLRLLSLTLNYYLKAVSRYT